MPRLFVHNFRFDATEESLIDAFSDYGQVTKVTIIKDHDTGRSKGYGFVDVDPLPQYAENLAGELNGMSLGGRVLNVEVARDKKGQGPSASRDGGSNGRNNGKKAKRSGRRERNQDDWRD